MDPNTVYVLESRLISMDGATQIPICSEEMAQLKSLCLAGTSGLEIPKLSTGNQILHVGK